jgi:DNA-binding CsgD family transcriptional regulator
VEQLVGREAELQALRDALATSPPLAIVLEGEAGIGKTALWRAGVEYAAANGYRTLVARPAEAETELSHAALDDLLSPIADECAPYLPDLQRHALEVALLRAPPGAAGVSPRAVGSATLAAIRAAAARGPLLVAIDDVQWLDPASAEALRFALRRLDDEPVVLLATHRLAGAGDRLDIGFADERLVPIGVGPLGPDALHWLLQSRLAASIPRPALERLAEMSGGNPYHALELARAALRHSGGEDVTADLPLPDTIFAVLQVRLRELPAPTTEALGTLAAMGRSSLDRADLAVDGGALEPAFAAGVLHEDRGAIRFDHPLLADAAYRLLTPAKRRSVHERLAELASDAEERARHLAASSRTPDAGVAGEIARGAEQAAARGSRSAAAELLEASAGVEPDADLAARRRIDAVRHHITGGNGRRAIALCNSLLEDLPPGPLRARALIVRSTEEGSFHELLEFARQAASEAGEDRELLIEALGMQGTLLVLIDRRDEAEMARQRARELCTPDVSLALRLVVLADSGDLAAHNGDPGAIAQLREAAQLEGDELIVNAQLGPTTVLAKALLLGDELDEARMLFEDRRRRAGEAGDDESVASLSIHLAELELRAGNVERARRLADEAVALQESSYGEHAQGAPAYARALAAAYQGEVEVARESGERGLAQCEAQGDWIFAAGNRAALGFLDVSVGDHAGAVDRLRPVMERFPTRHGLDPGMRQNLAIPDAIEALVALGRIAEAEDLLGAWKRAGERFDRPRIHATAARCRALMAAAEGDLVAAVAHAEEALEHHRDLPVPFERARTLIVLGTVHRRAKQKGAARAALDEAVEILDGMGARLWAERARVELGRIGGRAKEDGLTPTEARVADLVAEGLSNKAVAAELFVSVRTVEANLTRIYAKLGIRSRTELAATRRASNGHSRSPARPRALRS